MSKKPIPYILFIILIIEGCVSTKKYKSLEVKYNSSEESKNRYKKQNNYLDSINTAIVNENSLLNKKIEELTLTIKDMSNTIVVPLESSIPMIPNPPPSSTDYL